MLSKNQFLQKCNKPSLLRGASFLLLLFVALLLIACGSQNGSSEGAKDGIQATSGILAELDNANQKWQQQNIKSYYLEVLYWRDYFQDKTVYKITVKDNHVKTQSATITPTLERKGEAPTLSSFNANDFTIPALFETARSLAAGNLQKSSLIDQNPQKSRLQIKYDSVYGFPRQVYIESLDKTDNWTKWEVLTFQVLPSN
ncbi:MAG TPA: DUF6174 domain-containing protein [Chloroflexia bacterium]|nr:DUF6174 domain-containing protein [Chloroflexia bacterium]